MTQREFKIARLTDRQLVEAFQRLAKELELPTDTALNFVLTGGQKAIQFSVQIGALPSAEPLQAILGLESIVIQACNFYGPKPPRVHFQFSRPGPGHPDQFTLNLENVGEAVVAAKIIAAVAKHFPPLDWYPRLAEQLGGAYAEFYQQREKTLLELESVTRRIIEDNTILRRTLEEDALKRRGELEKAFAEDKKTLDADIAKQRAALDEREKALEVRLKEVDDSESRYARRQTRNELKKALAERAQKFTLTKGTRGLRWATHVFCIALMIGIASFIDVQVQHSMTTQAPQTTTDLFHYLLAAIGFAGTAIFYIRWTNQWFQQHANEEFRLKRFELDIDRATWLVEMALEWHKERGQELPKEFIERLARGLFEDTGMPPAAHPADSLSDFLRAAAGIKLKAGDAEISLDRKSMKEIE